MTSRRPPYLRVIGPNDPPPEEEHLGPLGPDDAALILRNTHGDSTCEVVFGWDPADPHTEVLKVLHTLAEAVRRSQPIESTKQQTAKPTKLGFFDKIKDRFAPEDEDT